LVPVARPRENFSMTVSRLRFTKSETRDLVDRARVWTPSVGDPIEWNLSNGWFVFALASIAAALVLFALALRY
jgi:hypothetical protein